ncbi:hypothetical protein MHYP_G00151640 [Metynnis hypsauchen]
MPAVHSESSMQEDIRMPSPTIKKHGRPKRPAPSKKPSNHPLSRPAQSAASGPLLEDGVMCPCRIVYSMKNNSRAENPHDFADILLSWGTLVLEMLSTPEK